MKTAAEKAAKAREKRGGEKRREANKIRLRSTRLFFFGLQKSNKAQGDPLRAEQLCSFLHSLMYIPYHAMPYHTISYHIYAVYRQTISTNKCINA